MRQRHFDLVSHWHIAAPAEQVWAALTDAPSWPDWWPQVRSVQTLDPGDERGLGRRHRIEWATGLHYGLELELEAIESLRPERLRGRSSGHLQGEGIWLLRETEGHTDVTYLWRVELTRPWMRWLAPLLGPLFRWNHHSVMCVGGAGLARHLAAAARVSAAAAPRTPA